MLCKTVRGKSRPSRPAVRALSETKGLDRFWPLAAPSGVVQRSRQVVQRLVPEAVSGAPASRAEPLFGRLSPPILFPSMSIRLVRTGRAGRPLW